ncbi:MAG: hypothetical protein PUB07_06975 [Clostridia bacterium]|nr:hypothetical protein [Clostridia bacterium]
MQGFYSFNPTDRGKWAYADSKEPEQNDDSKSFCYGSLGLEKNSAEWTNCAKAAGFGSPRRRTQVRREAKFVHSIKHFYFKKCMV